MSILFTCPHCGARTNVADEYAGQTGPCARCGNDIQVPAPAGALSRTGPPQAAGALLRPRRRPVLRAVAWTVLALLLAAVIVPCVLGVLLPSWNARRAADRQMACAANLHRIALALRSYHDQHGSFPPPFLADDAGRPAHSWRVLILPQLGEQELYAQYDFSQPWDGPANRPLVERMPAIYACPEAPSAAGWTGYAAVVGDGFVFDARKVTRLDEITDPHDGTVLLVEAAGAEIAWSEPRDLTADGLEFTVNAQNSAVRAAHRDGGHVALVDGTPYFVDPFGLAGEDDLRAMFTIAGDEPRPQPGF